VIGEVLALIVAIFAILGGTYMLIRAETRPISRQVETVKFELTSMNGGGTVKAYVRGNRERMRALTMWALALTKTLEAQGTPVPSPADFGLSLSEVEQDDRP
jgi:hypothetical protein